MKLLSIQLKILMRKFNYFFLSSILIARLSFFFDFFTSVCSYLHFIFSKFHFCLYLFSMFVYFIKSTNFRKQWGIVTNNTMKYIRLYPKKNLIVEWIKFWRLPFQLKWSSNDCVCNIIFVMSLYTSVPQSRSKQNMTST